MGTLPWAAVGTGAPVLLLPGLTPVTGVAGDRTVRTMLAPVEDLSLDRRVFVVNRRPGLPSDLTMSELAAEYADALRSSFPEPVDVVGLSTGGSIAQQLAAGHPDVVRRLVLLSTACRLGTVGREVQTAVADRLRSGDRRGAAATAAAALLPSAGRVAAGVGWLFGPSIFRTPDACADLVATIDAEDGFDLAGCPRPIEATTLIIGGARDRFYSPELFQETHALIPNSQLALLPTRGHTGVARDRRALAQLAGFLNFESTGPDEPDRTT